MAILVKGDTKAPFSIATTPRCWGRLLLHSQDFSTLTLISAEWYARQHQVPFFEFLVWLDLELNPSIGHPNQRKKYHMLAKTIYWGLYLYTECNRNIPRILNCHLCGASECRQVAMVAPSSKYFTIFLDMTIYDYAFDWCTPCIWYWNIF